jgi:hypothetical protein
MVVTCSRHGVAGNGGIMAPLPGTDYYMFTTRLTFYAFVAALVCVIGCATTTEPLNGWTFLPFPGWGANPNGHNNNVLDKAIVDDYKGYIAQNKLDLLGAITGFLEDGSGQRAIEFEALSPGRNAAWHYAIIYNNENKRVKVIKYGHHRFQS